MPIVAVISIIIFPPWSIVWTWVQPLPDTVHEQVEAAMNHDLDGIIVFVDQGGRAPEKYAAGWKDKFEKIEMSPDNLYRIASITKLYIASAMVKLIHDDSLSLEDTLAELLPELTNRIDHSDEITLKMIIGHRSGIPNFTDSPNLKWGKTTENPDEDLALVLDQPANFAPDAKYQYSNTNYLLLGKIMDRVLGYPHHVFIQNRILNPLELTDSYYKFRYADHPERLVSGYGSGWDGDWKELDYSTPGGQMVATAEDVGKFLRAMHDGSLFTEEEQETYSSVYFYEHTGLLPGYQSWAQYSEESDAIVIQFVNTTGGYSWEKGAIIKNRIFKIIERRDK